MSLPPRVGAHGRVGGAEIGQLGGARRRPSIRSTVLVLGQHAPFTILLNGLNLEVLEDVNFASGAKIRGRAAPRVLAEVELRHRGHEAEFDGQSDDAIAAQVQKRQLEVGDFCMKNI